MTTNRHLPQVPMSEFNPLRSGVGRDFLTSENFPLSELSPNGPKYHESPEVRKPIREYRMPFGGPVGVDV